MAKKGSKIQMRWRCNLLSRSINHLQNNTAPFGPHTNWQNQILKPLPKARRVGGHLTSKGTKEISYFIYPRLKKGKRIDEEREKDDRSYFWDLKSRQCKVAKFEKLPMDG